MRKLSIILLLCSSAFAQWPYDNKPMLGQQINWAHPLSKGLVGLWLMNEGSGGQVKDLSGNGNDGVLVGGVSWAIGKYLGLNFPGSDDYVNCGTGSSIDITGNMTIVAGISPNSAPVNYSQIANKEDISSAGYSFILHSDRTIQFWIGDDTDFQGVQDATTALQDNIFYQVVGRYDGTNISVFVNGQKEGSDVAQSPPATNAGTLGLGIRHRNLDREFKGKIFYVYIYNRALSASTEITLLHREPFGMFEVDNVALMAVEAPAPTGGQIIMITSLPLLFIGLYLWKYKEAA